MNTLEQINIVLKKIQDLKKKINVTSDSNITREEYKNKHNLPKDFNFSLSAEDIIKDEIPYKVIGCTGLAKLFVYYAKQIGLECSIVFTAKVEDLMNKKRIDGHQLISVKFENKEEIIFDPQESSLKPILFDNNGMYIHNNTPHIITAKQDGEKINLIKSYDDLEQIYLSNKHLQQKNIIYNQKAL